MTNVVFLLKPYAAFELIDPKADGDPYFTLRLTGLKRGHSIVRRLIHEFSFEPDQAKGQYIAIHHEIGHFVLYGSGLLPVWQRLDHIHDLVVFDPSYHQPVTDSSAPIFTRMEVKDYGKCYPHVRQGLAS